MAADVRSDVRTIKDHASVRGGYADGADDHDTDDPMSGVEEGIINQGEHAGGDSGDDDDDDDHDHARDGDVGLGHARHGVSIVIVVVMVMLVMVMKVIAVWPKDLVSDTGLAPDAAHL